MKSSIQNINDIAPIGQQNTGQVSSVQAEYDQGKALLERNETGPAAVALHNALVGFEEKKDEKGIANASNQLGMVCIRRGEYEQALVHFRRAEEICNTLGDPMSLIALCKQFILVYTETEQYKEAIVRCLDLLDIYHANNDPRGTVAILEQMADIYVKSNDPAKAADAYRTAASIHRNFRHDNIAAELVKKAEALEKSFQG